MVGIDLPFLFDRSLAERMDVIQTLRRRSYSCLTWTVVIDRTARSAYEMLLSSTPLIDALHLGRATLQGAWSAVRTASASFGNASSGNGRTALTLISLKT